MIRAFWFVSELGSCAMPAYKKKAHGFQSLSASMNCSFFQVLFSIPLEWFLSRSIATTFSSGVKKRALIGESGTNQ